MVRTNTLNGPGGDAAIVRIKGTDTAVAISLDGNGRYCSLDPREGAKLAVAEACRNISTVGAQPMAATNNLNFGNPQKPEIMAQLVEAIEGMADACLHFETPITGGNVSLYNETLGEGIHPTPVMGIVGVLKVGKPTPIEFQSEGKTVLLLGGFRESTVTHFGGTQYANVIGGGPWGLPPALDMDYEKRVHSAIRKIVTSGLAESAHDLSDGGLAVALAESSFGGIGARVTLPPAERPEIQLFHEAPSRILISTANVQEIKAIADEFQVEVVELGSTLAGKLVIADRIDASIEELREPWSTSLERMLHA
jgi:phosphoribosylformylglycinamidine (FGAM) synthase-like enzyme